MHFLYIYIYIYIYIIYIIYIYIFIWATYFSQLIWRISSKAGGFGMCPFEEFVHLSEVDMCQPGSGRFEAKLTEGRPWH